MADFCLRERRTTYPNDELDKIANYSNTLICIACVHEGNWVTSFIDIADTQENSQWQDENITEH